MENSIPGLLSNQSDTAGSINTPVAPLTTFRSVLDDGTVVQSQKPLGFQKSEPRFYYSAFPHNSMHRQDGVKIAFAFHIAEVIDRSSQNYLEQEIENGNSFIRHATPAEVDAFLAHRNPRGHMEAKLRDELAPQIKRELIEEIRKQLLQEMAASGGVPPLPAQNDEQKLSGTDSLQILRERLKTGTVGKDNGVTVLPTPNEGPLMTSQPAPLKGIVSSDNVKDLSAGSAQGGPVGPAV